MRREQALLLARYGHRALARPHLDAARRELCGALPAHVSPDWEWEELRAAAAAIGATDLLLGSPIRRAAAPEPHSVAKPPWPTSGT